VADDAGDKVVNILANLAEAEITLVVAETPAVVVIIFASTLVPGTFVVSVPLALAVWNVSAVWNGFTIGLSR